MHSIKNKCRRVAPTPLIWRSMQPILAVVPLVPGNRHVSLACQTCQFQFSL
jgi:hypothetical protein